MALSKLRVGVDCCQELPYCRQMTWQYHIYQLIGHQTNVELVNDLQRRAVAEVA